LELGLSARWLILVALLLLCGLFAAAETSLFALRPLERLRLKEKHPRRGELVESLLSRPRRLLITVLMGVEIVNILASVVATSLALALWGLQGKWLVLGAIAPGFLLLGEIVPKSLALAYPAGLARWLAPLVKPAIFLLTPLRVVFLQVSRGILATLGFRPDLPVPTVQQEDFVRMVEESHRRGLIAPMERDFIQNLLTFGELRVGQIMVPRPDMFTLPVDLPPAQLLQAIKHSRFSRVPIYKDHPGEILGILHAKDLLDVCSGETCKPGFIEQILRPPYYVPENKRAFDLLTELQTQHLRLALVVDEYGTLVGLVTVEDLLEELCGEIPQEFKVEEKLLQEVGPGLWRVKAVMSLTDFNEALNLALPTEEFDTVGGLVLNLVGTLPREGMAVSYDGLTFRVLRMKGTRILELEVRRSAP
jgi:CBS domain containing-hemolysin-like protein